MDTNKKRKNLDNIELNRKIQKIIKSLNKINVENKKRKCISVNNLNKKQKSCNCIIHEEKYICDIYECNGKINRDRFKI
jgi:hypothetical protein